MRIMRVKIHIRGVLSAFTDKPPHRKKKLKPHRPPKGVRKMENHPTDAFIIKKLTLLLVFLEAAINQGFRSFIRTGCLHKNPQTNYINWSAVILIGVTALLLSTYFCVFAVISVYSNSISRYRASALMKIYVFLLQPIADKLCYNPGCRSPPFTFVFEKIQTSKNEWRKGK